MTGEQGSGRLSQAEKRKRVNHPGFHFADVLLLPNLLSLSRLMLAIPAVVLIVRGGSNQVAAGLLLAAFLTDALDGMIARTFRVISDLGKLIDPAADKIIVISTAIALSLGHRDPRFPLFLVAAIVLRDLLIVFFALRVLKEDHHLFTSSWPGKVTTFVIAVTLLVYLLPEYAPVKLIVVLPYVVLSLLALSSVDYLEKYWSVRHKLRAGRWRKRTGDEA